MLFLFGFLFMLWLVQILFVTVIILVENPYRLKEIFGSTKRLSLWYLPVAPIVLTIRDKMKGINKL